MPFAPESAASPVWSRNCHEADEDLCLLLYCRCRRLFREDEHAGRREQQRGHVLFFRVWQLGRDQQQRRLGEQRKLGQHQRRLRQQRRGRLGERRDVQQLGER